MRLPTTLACLLALALSTVDGLRAGDAAAAPPNDLHAAEAKRKELQLKHRFAENQVRRHAELAPLASARDEAADKVAWATAFEPDLAAGRERLDGMKQAHKELIAAKAAKDADLAGLKSKREELRKQAQELDKQIQEREKLIAADAEVAASAATIKQGEEQLKERTAANPKVKASADELEAAKKAYDDAYQAKLKEHAGAQALAAQLAELDRVLGKLRDGAKPKAK